MTVKFVWAVTCITVSVAGAGWASHSYLHDTFAAKEAVQVAGGKADFVIDRQMEAVISQIAYLERKQNKTPSELNQLNYLRQQLENMRKVRAGK